MIRVRLVRQDSFTGVEVLANDGAYRGILGGICHGTTAFLTSGGGRPSKGVGRLCVISEVEIKYGRVSAWGQEANGEIVK